MQIDIFMDAAFDAVRRDVGLLQIKLRALNSKLMSNRVSSNVAESMAEVIAQQCEASVQVLQSLCQPHVFRDKVLNHKVRLCLFNNVLWFYHGIHFSKFDNNIRVIDNSHLFPFQTTS